MDTYYMTRKNYEDMKARKIPKVYIPLGRESGNYSVPLTAVVIHYAPIVGCIIKTPFQRHVVSHIVTPVSRYATTMIYYVTGSLLGKSGVYTYICSGMNRSAVTGLQMREILTVSLHLKFVQGVCVLSWTGLSQTSALEVVKLSYFYWKGVQNSAPLFGGSESLICMSIL